MRLLLFIVPFFASWTAAQGDTYKFIYPGQPGADSDYDTDPVIPLGSNMNISWLGPTNKSISMVLFQQRPNDTQQTIFRKPLSLSSLLHYG